MNDIIVEKYNKNNTISLTLKDRFYMSENKKLTDIIKNLEIGIGEVSRSIGITQRQLRYWEKKGYIAPIIDNNSGVRRYNLSTVYLILFIKNHLDEGYTLEAAVKHSKVIYSRIIIMQKLFAQLISNIEITDNAKRYGQVKLGEVELGNKIIEISAVADKKGNHFELNQKGKNQ